MSTALRSLTVAVAAALALAGCATMPGRMPGTARAPTPGEVVLAAGYRMALQERRVVVGSCWDFVEAVYREAGYPPAARATVFQGRRSGPYADADALRPGDWVMHLNLEYNGVEHSSIFVGWADRARRIARTLDYVGMNRKEPGKISQHSYAKIFSIVRPVGPGARGAP